MRYFSYWLIPLFSGLVWLSMLLGMLLFWVVERDSIQYSSKRNRPIAYISDIGAREMKPLFIVGCVLTGILLDTSLLMERWLRHRERLLRNQTPREKYFSIAAIVFAFFGTIGLILLSVFDNINHGRIHGSMLVLFIAGYLLSAFFVCWEYLYLGCGYRDERRLRYSFIIKVSFFVIEFVLAIAFAVNGLRKSYVAGAILEWTISFIFSFYALSFIADLWPAIHTRPPSLEKGTRPFPPSMMTATHHQPHSNNGSHDPIWQSSSIAQTVPVDMSPPSSAYTTPQFFSHHNHPFHSPSLDKYKRKLSHSTNRERRYSNTNRWSISSQGPPASYPVNPSTSSSGQDDPPTPIPGGLLFAQSPPSAPQLPPPRDL